MTDILLQLISAVAIAVGIVADHRAERKKVCIRCGGTQFQAAPTYTGLCAECWQKEYGSLDRQLEKIMMEESMGTNFYHITRSGFLGLFGKTEERHIGKSSRGWQFGFRGYVERRDIGMSKTVVIGSWAQWKKILCRGKIVDEYGERWSYADFVKLVEKTKGGLIDHDDDWKDAEGWGFSTTEFC